MTCDGSLCPMRSSAFMHVCAPEPLRLLCPCRHTLSPLRACSMDPSTLVPPGQPPGLSYPDLLVPLFKNVGYSTHATSECCVVGPSTPQLLPPRCCFRVLQAGVLCRLL